MSSENSKTAREPLVKQIMSFRRWRNWIAVPLIVVGAASLVLPIIPGLLILFIGILLIKPDFADSIRERVMQLTKRSDK